MSLSSFIQSSFAAGEISPDLSGRVDIAKYQSGLSRCRNFIVTPYGSVKNRPGSVFVEEAKFADKQCRVVPFIFDEDQAYIWEIGDEYIRFYTDQAQIGVLEETDPYTKLLLHGEGADASTTITDSSFSPKSGTAVGNAQIDTAQFKFGSAAILFDGTGDRVTFADHADWDLGSGDFTIEAWVRLVNTSGNNMICGRVTSGTSYFYFGFEGTTFRFRDFHASANVVNISSVVTISTATWYHCAIVRSGNNFMLFLDGVQQGSTVVDADALTDRAVVLEIGSMTDNATYVMNGWIDDFRWTKGLARYTANFTPPTVTFEDPTEETVAYELVMPYAEADLSLLRFESSADVTYITSPDFQPRTLSRLADDDWELDTYESDDGPFMPQNITDTTLAVSATTGTVTLTASAALFAALHVGALFKLKHYVESQTVSQSFTGTGTSSGVSCFTTWRLITHGTWTGKFRIEKSTDGGSTWTILRTFSSSNDFNANTFGTEDIETNEVPFLVRINAYSFTSGTLSVDLTTDPFFQEGIVRITVVATNISATATVLQTVASTTATDTWSEGSWSDYRGWPRVARFFQDRLCFASTYSEPQTFWQTETSNYTSFVRHNPLLDTDGISSPLPSRQVNAINGLIALRKLVVFTAATEWSVGPTSGNALTPTTVETLPQGYRGSYGLEPAIVGNEAIYVQANSKVIRNLSYQFGPDGYVGSDLNILSKHLFDKFTIVELAYQQDPDSVVWMNRDDGIMLGLTYMAEQEVIAWHWHDTGGNDGVSGGDNAVDKIESICTIPGDGYDELWMSVFRSNGRFIERMSQRFISTECAGEREIKIENQIFLDSCVTFKNQFDIENISVDASGNVDVTLTEAHGLTNGHKITIDCVEGMDDVNGITFTMQNITDTATVLLLHMEGADGGSTFTDSSSYARTVTPSGGAVTDDAQKALGTTSALFGGGATNQLRISDSDDFHFGSGDFTIELRYRPYALGYTKALISQWADSGSGGAFYLYHSLADDGHTLKFTYSTSATGTPPTGITISSNTVMVIDTWYAIAVVRDGNTLRFFINGIQTNTATITGTLFNSTYQVNISSYQDGSSANQAIEGWIDEVRVTKGVARYTGNYTVATTPFTIERMLRLYTVGGSPIDGSAYDEYISGGHLNAEVTSFSGLDHLDGQTVGILADGIPQDQQVVSSGAITLSGDFFVVHVGLPIIADIETLKPEVVLKNGTLQNRKVKIGNVTFRVTETRGGWIGPNEDELYEAFPSAIEDKLGSDDLTLLFTGDLRQPSNDDYEDGGQVFYRQRDPLPVHILAIIPELEVGDPAR